MVVMVTHEHADRHLVYYRKVTAVTDKSIIVRKRGSPGSYIEREK